MIYKVKAAQEELISINEPTGDVAYYVDAENGNDDNDGTSPETAWKTLRKASSNPQTYRRWQNLTESRMHMEW